MLGVGWDSPWTRSNRQGWGGRQRGEDLRLSSEGGGGGKADSGGLPGGSAASAEGSPLLRLWAPPLPGPELALCSLIEPLAALSRGWPGSSVSLCAGRE